MQVEYQKVVRASSARVDPSRLVAASWAFTASATSLATMGGWKPHLTYTRRVLLVILSACWLAYVPLLLGDLTQEG